MLPLLIVPLLSYLNFYSSSSNLMVIVPPPYISATMLSHSPSVKCSLNLSIGFLKYCDFRLNSTLDPICIPPITKLKMKALILSEVHTFPTSKKYTSGVYLLQEPVCLLHNSNIQVTVWLKFNCCLLYFSLSLHFHSALMWATCSRQSLCEQVLL